MGRFKTHSDQARERVLLEVTGPQPLPKKTLYADFKGSEIPDDPRFRSDPSKAATCIEISREEARARRRDM